MPDGQKPDMDLDAKTNAEFDLLIRSALATYAKPASEADLVHGILARVAVESVPTRARRWLPWAIAIPVLACLLALVALFAPKPARMPAHDQEQAHLGRPALEPPVQTHPSVPVHPSKDLHTSESRRVQSSVEGMRSVPALVSAKSAPVPKLDVFPTPQPLTPGESALVAFVAQVPASERQSYIGSKEHLQEPLAISAIEIQPIDSPDQGGN